MNLKQHTIGQAVSLTGQGLHTGEFVTITLKPANINHGIVFQRIDLDNSPLVPADVDYVVDTSRSTILEKDDARIGTVEHLMAAIAGLQIDNLLIEVNGPEIPILDGSAILFVELLEKATLQEQNALRNYFEITEAIHFKNEEKNIELAALPLNDYRLTVMVDFNSNVLNSQHAQLHEIELFKEHIAPCRTFVFVHEIEQLAKLGLIKGGSLDNAVVISETELTDIKIEELSNVLNKPLSSTIKSGIINDEPLKFVNEPARHKLLDLLGDLALVGRPFKAHILAARPGHQSNIELAKKNKKTNYSSKQICPFI